MTPEFVKKFIKYLGERQSSIAILGSLATKNFLPSLFNFILESNILIANNIMLFINYFPPYNLLILQFHTLLKICSNIPNP